MATTIYVIRSFGGVLIVQSTQLIPEPPYVIIARSRDGIVSTQARDAIMPAKSRNGIASTTTHDAITKALARDAITTARTV